MNMFYVKIIVPFYKCPTHYSYSYSLFLLHKFDSLFRVFLLNHVFILFSFFFIFSAYNCFSSPLCAPLISQLMDLRINLFRNLWFIVLFP